MSFCKINIRLAAILFLVFVFIGFVAVRAQSYDIYEYDVMQIDETDSLYISNYEVQGNHYEVVGEDPKVIYDLGDEKKESYGLRLYFEKAPESIQIYYADTPDSFSESDSIIVSDEKDGMMEVVFGNQKVFRLDIDEDFVLSKIELLVDRTEIHIEHKSAYGMALVISLLLAALLSCLNVMNQFYSKKEMQVRHGIKKALANWKQIAFTLFILAALLGVAVGFEKVIIQSLLNKEFHRDRIVVMYAVLILVFAGLRLWKTTLKKPEYLFAITAGIIGTVIILVVPNACGISWDDEIHYKNTSQISYGLNGHISYADMVNIHHYTQAILERDVYGTQQQAAWNREINEIAETYDTVVEYEASNAYATYVAYLPGAFGLMVGRAFDLNYTHIFMLGKFMNLFVYILAFSIAIRVIQRGKILLCAIGLIPTSLFWHQIMHTTGG